ncbi:hypothetical protein GJ744_005335 [Endocarpon pusillum]|uniref:Maltogenic Amylase C-terminal domain-containing protein n=1 Tax=Endocarpon pusillum TaxID=364733 RepID=A0A8H7E5E2_9EURO|nr:hypothetical protein GJ744_005335 [Endocarpon pusillum]
MMRKVKTAIAKFGRDNAMTPMQWSGSKPHAGGAQGYEDALRMWKSKITLRREHESTFVYGRFEIPDMDNKELVMYTKKGDEEDVLVVLNFTDQEQKIPILDTLSGRKMEILALTGKESGHKLDPWDGRVYKLSRGDVSHKRN